MLTLNIYWLSAVRLAYRIATNPVARTLIVFALVAGVTAVANAMG